MFICQGCGAEFEGHKIRVYCSNACQWSSYQKRLTQRWLASGVAVAGSHHGHYIRVYLYDAQGGRCAICGMGRVWNDKTLYFVLDHVDGDPTNNARENLRLICPNCDSQLPTFKSRNKGNGRHYRRQRYADGKSY